MRLNNDHYTVVLSRAEIKAEFIIHYQVRDEKCLLDYGGIISPELGLCNPGEAIKSLLILISLYLNNDSQYYLNNRVLISLELLFEYIERIQREDGTFDLVTTNFYSGPDTGFSLHNLVYTYRIIDEYIRNKSNKYWSSMENEDNLSLKNWQERLFNIIRSAAYGVCRGGFHTPNHRWVNTAALLMAYNVIKVDLFKEMAGRYLAEGIDCDKNGEYTERSSGIYNATNNDSLIKIAEETGDWSLLEYVERNLDMMFNYIEPDGSIFTENSIRQDKGGKQMFYPIPYYHIYLFMAREYGDGGYYKMANTIINDIELWEPDPAEGLMGNYIYLFILKPELKDLSNIKELSVSSNYHRFYEKSGLVRSRRENYSYTLLKDNSSFLFFQAGKLNLCLKITASFFASAIFKAESLERIGDSYLMSFSAVGSYKLPFKNPSGTSDWWEMDHSKRDIVNRLELTFRISVREIENGLNIRVKTEGCDRVPLKIECTVSADSIVEGENFVIPGKAGDSILVKRGKIKIIKDMDIISIGPAFAKHNYTSQMRGSEGQSRDRFTIYFTDFTNLDRDITIKSEKTRY